MLPCTLNRCLKLYPGLEDRSKLHEVLTPESDLWQHLPPPFSRPMTKPYLWHPSNTLTLDLVAQWCLKTMFRCCHTQVVV